MAQAHRIINYTWPAGVRNVAGLTLALGSLKQQSQRECGDVGNRNESAAKQQYFPFCCCCLTGCGSLCPAPILSGQALNISHPVLQLKILFTFRYKSDRNMRGHSVNGSTMAILLLHSAPTWSGGLPKHVSEQACKHHGKVSLKDKK